MEPPKEQETKPNETNAKEAVYWSLQVENEK